MSLGRKLREGLNQYGYENTVKFFHDSRKAGKITEGQISLRDLAEGLIGPDWVRQLSASRSRGSEVLREAGADGTRFLREAGPDALGPSFFSNITGQLLVDRIWQKYNAPEFVGKRMVRTIPCGPNLGEHKVPGLSRVYDAPSLTQPGEAFPHTKFSERWKVLVPPAKYGEICALTFEMIYSDLTGQAMESADSVGWQVGYWEEEQRLKVIMGLTNNYKESVSNAGTATSKNTYQSTLGDWVNAQTGQTLTTLRPVQSLRLKLRRITDPETGKRIAFTGNYPLFVMPGRELDALRIVRATQIRMGDITTGTGDQTISDNVLQGVSEVITSPIAEQLQLDASVTQTNLDEYFWHGAFTEAFYERVVHEMQTVQAPPMNPAEFNNDIVLAVRAKTFKGFGVYDPRRVGSSINV